MHTERSQDREEPYFVSERSDDLFLVYRGGQNRWFSGIFSLQIGLEGSSLARYRSQFLIFLFYIVHTNRYVYGEEPYLFWEQSDDYFLVYGGSKLAFLGLC